jgi:hypothetical protein
LVLAFSKLCSLRSKSLSKIGDGGGGSGSGGGGGGGGRTSQSDEAVEEEEEDMFEIEIEDETYCTNNEENGFIWKINDEGEQGEKVGYIKDGEPFFYADEI